MEKILMLGVALAVIGFVFQFLNEQGKGGMTKKEEWLPYMKKSFLLTRAEHEFFNTLERVIGGQYYIFPQLAPDKIVLLSGKGSFTGGYRNRINQKSVDFVLFDKQNISPVLVIELDDYTHDKQDRKDRDSFVDRVMSHCGIPIIHTRLVTEENLRAQISAKIKI